LLTDCRRCAPRAAAAIYVDLAYAAKLTFTALR
jgi:hypothetical protein